MLNVVINYELINAINSYFIKPNIAETRSWNKIKMIIVQWTGTDKEENLICQTIKTTLYD